MSGCRAAAPLPKPDDDRIRAALAEMMKEVMPKPHLPHRPRQYSNWRTRKIIDEIRALRSAESVCEYEEELRGLITSQESRLFGKLMAEFLTRECCIEEQHALSRDERMGREALREELKLTLGHPMELVSLMLDEEENRYYLRKEREAQVKTMRILRAMSVLRTKEAEDRRLLAAQEQLSMSELRQRRFIEVGHEVQLELAKQNHLDLFVWIHEHSRDYVRSVGDAVKREERDRVSIEKISFLQLSLLYNQAENDLLTSVKRTVEATTLFYQRRADVVAREVRAKESMEKLVSQEESLRLMIMHAEQDEHQAVHNAFVVGWRNVYQDIIKGNDLAVIITSIELFERRYIHDQYRHGLVGIQSWYDNEHRFVLRRDHEVKDFYQSYIASVSALWSKEHEEHCAMHKKYHFYVAETRMIQATRVLALDEERHRRRIVGDHAKCVLTITEEKVLDRLVVDASDSSSTIAHLESSAWDSLMRQHYVRAVQIPLDTMQVEEQEARLRLESMEQEAAVELFSQSMLLQHMEGVLSATAGLCAVENRWRVGIRAMEQRAREPFLHLFCASAEHQQRRFLCRVERWHRVELHKEMLRGTELTARQSMLEEEARDRAIFGSARFSAEEALCRQAVVRSEAARRHFLVGSVPYDHLFLRACEVDELSHRLDIINEAELTIRACAYGNGHDARVCYCEEDLRLQKVQLHFLSLEQLWQVYEHDFDAVVEPQSRQQLEDAWSGDFLRMKVAYEEEKCRLKLMEAEVVDRSTVTRVACRALGDQAKMEQLEMELLARSMSVEEQLLEYLTEQDTQPKAASVEECRHAVRDQLQPLLDDFYWSRDANLLEESVQRQCIYERFRGLITDVDYAPVDSLEVHSIAIVSSPYQSPSTLCVRHSDEVEEEQVDLKLMQKINVSGQMLDICIPSCCLRWSADNTDAMSRGVLFFTVLDQFGGVMASASVLLSTLTFEESSSATLLLDGDRGRMHLVAHHV